MPLDALDLASPVTSLPGVGPRMAQLLARLDIRSIADLLRHLPMRYEHELAEQTIASAGDVVGMAHGSEANIAVRGEIAALRVGHGRKPRIEATVQDGTGTMRLVWFNAPWLRRSLHPGLRVFVQGKARRYGDYLEMVNPRWEPLPEGDEPATRAEGHQPIYPATEDLPSRRIADLVGGVLEAALPQIRDHLPEAFRAERQLPTLAEAYRMAHRPRDPQEIAIARRRLAYDELLLLQLAVMMKRRHLREASQAEALRWSDAIDRHILERLPFQLTPAQRAVVDEIATDLANTVPMNRLLQGDVGAGKTVVALHGMLMAVASRRQAALLAPTELLAEQHFATIGRMLAGSNVRIALLTGTLSAAERAATAAGLESGTIDIVVGTHALLNGSVRFHSLAYAVIDEQHRFGVAQRAVMRAKAGGDDAVGTVPHVLVMTATPIPRTLSLTVFGDLDVSTIRELPPGRQPVATRVVGPERSDDVYAFVRKRIEGGEQAYVVVPAVDESDLGLKDTSTHLEWLSKGHFSGLRLAAVHGRLDRSERDDVMSRFRAGEIDVLVATVVIEVGVDVPNASLMVIEHAERFGLAQLHQLRGRVGRGHRKSLCAMIAEPTTDEAQKRLQAIAASTDGFAIAERDLEIRGPGELFGARQSGLPPFRVAELPRDMRLLASARRDAEAWIAESPTLSKEGEDLLRRRVMKAYGEAMGLGDVG
ncbi:MAG: ATP-dependent DNA helicase RecG [Phycisphaerales bacterium]|nr:ATP-dependent DNA helicase RecG [Phycisphaerales bacterium]